MFYLTILYVFQIVIGFFQSYLFSSINENIIFDLKRDMYNKVLNLPIKAFDEMQVGEFISRLHGDASAITNIITNQFLSIIVDILKVVITGATIFSINLSLALIVLASFPFSFLIFAVYGKKLRDKNSELTILTDKYISNMQQSILGIREVKNLGIKNNNFNLFLSLAAMLKRKTVNISILNTFSQTLAQTTNFMSQIVVILLVVCNP